MDFRVKQGLILGFVVGIALFALFYYLSQDLRCLMLIPIGGVMGAAPQFLKPKDLDEDD